MDVLLSPAGEILGMQGNRFFKDRYERGNIAEAFGAMLNGVKAVV
jgi:hypothetical protein